MIDFLFKASLIVAVHSLVIGYLSSFFRAPKFSNSVFNEYNWADIVSGLCLLAFIPSSVILTYAACYKFVL